MRGFSFWTCSQVKPMRSSAPGAKFSTITSQVFTSASSTAFPCGLRPSMVIDRLLWFSMVKYRLSTLGMSCSCPRVMSPTPGRSTLITSAPNQASNCVQVGPDWTWVKSRMRTPLSAFVIVFAPYSRPRIGRAYWGLKVCSLLLQDALRIEVADAAAFGAGGRIDHRVDQGRLAGIHRLVDGA